MSHSQSTPQAPPAHLANQTPHTPYALQDDAINYGDWVVDGAWFYDSTDRAFYRLTTETAPYTFTLDRADCVATPSSDSTASPSSDDSVLTSHSVSTITELAGELEAGRLHGVLPGNSYTFDNLTLTNTGKFLILACSEDCNRGRESLTPLLPTDSWLLRYASPTPATLNSLREDGAASEPTANALCEIYAVDADPEPLLAALDADIGDDDTADPSPNPQKEHADPQHPATTADGGGADSIHLNDNPHVESLPYYPAEDHQTISRFVQTDQHVSDTFTVKAIRDFVLNYVQGRVLNVCAGPTRISQWYNGGEVVRNDISPEVESDLSVDIAELAAHLPESSFDTILYDPPFTHYQSRLRYDSFRVHKSLKDDLPVDQISIDIRDLPFPVPGERAIAQNNESQQLHLDSFNNSDGREHSVEIPDSQQDIPDDYLTLDESKDQLGHARLAKIGFDYLLGEGGRVIQLSYTGSNMPAALGYDQVARTSFNPTGIYKMLVGAVDQKY